jgi:hypothetical protein
MKKVKLMTALAGIAGLGIGATTAITSCNEPAPTPEVKKVALHVSTNQLDKAYPEKGLIATVVCTNFSSDPKSIEWQDADDLIITPVTTF